MTRYNRDDAGVDVAIVNPTDRLRWGPILGGVFAAITTAAILSTLGAAIGMSVYDRSDDPRNFAIGFGIWGIVTMILSYALGGWIAARSAAFWGRNVGLLNGAMVAAVGIPLMLFLLGSAGAMMGGAAASSDHRGAGAQARMGSSGGGAMSQGFDEATQAAGRITPGDPAASAASGGGASGGGGSAAPSEEAARAGSRAAWGTLAALVLAIASSALGGYLGSRDRDDTRGRTGSPAVA
jgi:hypothetical protein